MSIQTFQQKQMLLSKPNMKQKKTLTQHPDSIKYPKTSIRKYKTDILDQKFQGSEE